MKGSCSRFCSHAELLSRLPPVGPGLTVNAIAPTFSNIRAVGITPHLAIRNEAEPLGNSRGSRRLRIPTVAKQPAEVLANLGLTIGGLDAVEREVCPLRFDRGFHPLPPYRAKLRRIRSMMRSCCSSKCWRGLIWSSRLVRPEPWIDGAA